MAIQSVGLYQPQGVINANNEYISNLSKAGYDFNQALADKSDGEKASAVQEGVEDANQYAKDVLTSYMLSGDTPGQAYTDAADRIGSSAIQISANPNGAISASSDRAIDIANGFYDAAKLYN